MPQSSIVWMVHARTSIEGVRGTLSLDGPSLVFVPDGGRAAETILPLGSINRVRRARGTPVLEVAVDLPNAPPIIGFYFIEPPPLAQPGAGLRIFEHFLAKRRAVIKLQVGNTTKRDEVDRWVQSIRTTKAELKDQGTGGGG
jgi:hypothetical protein